MASKNTYPCISLAMAVFGVPEAVSRRLRDGVFDGASVAV